MSVELYPLYKGVQFVPAYRRIIVVSGDPIDYGKWESLDPFDPLDVGGTVLTGRTGLFVRSWGTSNLSVEVLTVEVKVEDRGGVLIAVSPDGTERELVWKASE